MQSVWLILLPGSKGEPRAPPALGRLPLLRPPDSWQGLCPPTSHKPSLAFTLCLGCLRTAPSRRSLCVPISPHKRPQILWVSLSPCISLFWPPPLGSISPAPCPEILSLDFVMSQSGISKPLCPQPQFRLSPLFSCSRKTAPPARTPLTSPATSQVVVVYFLLVPVSLRLRFGGAVLLLSATQQTVHLLGNAHIWTLCCQARPPISPPHSSPL